MNSAKYKQLINIAKQQMAMDEDSYRGNLIIWTGKESLKTMTTTELAKAYKGMCGLGFKAVNKSGNAKNKGISQKFFDDHPEARKLGWIWSVMKAQGFIKQGSYTALEKWAIPQSKRLNNGVQIEKLEWMGDILFGLIEQLKEYHKRLMITNGWIVDQIHQVEVKLANAQLPVMSDDERHEMALHQGNINAVKTFNLDNTSHENLSKCYKAIVYFNGLVKK